MASLYTDLPIGGKSRGNFFGEFPKMRCFLKVTSGDHRGGYPPGWRYIPTYFLYGGARGIRLQYPKLRAIYRYVGN